VAAPGLFIFIPGPMDKTNLATHSWPRKYCVANSGQDKYKRSQNEQNSIMDWGVFWLEVGGGAMVFRRHSQPLNN
jgi:hypothetical protein